MFFPSGREKFVSAGSNDLEAFEKILQLWEDVSLARAVTNRRKVGHKRGGAG